MQAALAAAGTVQATTTCSLKQAWARGLCVPLSPSVSAACALHAPQGSERQCSACGMTMQHSAHARPGQQAGLGQALTKLVRGAQWNCARPCALKTLIAIGAVQTAPFNRGFNWGTTLKK